MAAVVVALYVSAAVAATAVAVVTGDHVAPATFLVPDLPWEDTTGWAPLPVFAAVCALNAWMLWQVLRGPALPRAAGLGRQVRWLRRLLYLSVAGLLVLWDVLDRLPGQTGAVVPLGVEIAKIVLLARVIAGISAAHRAAILVLGLVSVAPTPLLLLGEATGLELDARTFFFLDLAALAWLAPLLAGQRRDGRWSRATVATGWWVLGLSLGYSLVFGFLMGLRGGNVLIAAALEALNVMVLVWTARTAHELAAPPPPAVRARPPRLAAATTALVLVAGLVAAEDGSRATFSGRDERCDAWIDGSLSYDATPPQDRRAAFLCLARQGITRSPMFPGDVPDQRILAHGKALCTEPGPPWEEELTKMLIFLCPDVAGRRIALAARDLAVADRAEKARVAAANAERNARCADPWPKVRARRQGTAAYELFEAGGYYVLDDRDESSHQGADVHAAIDDGFIDAAGSSAVVMTYGENETICVTVKAFTTAPPRRLRGWDDVAEVGIASVSGRLIVPELGEWDDGGALKELPSLAIGGPGHYRMRVYARHREHAGADLPAEEHLIVVYPGRSTRKIVYVP
ncbi:hypothetical protein [Nonomuraea sp. NPDC002799]